MKMWWCAPEKIIACSSGQCVAVFLVTVMKSEAEEDAANAWNVEKLRRNCAHLGRGRADEKSSTARPG